MPDKLVDPSSLEGEDLDNWYRRSPDEVEQDRQAAAAREYNEFFLSGREPNAPPTSPESDGPPLLDRANARPDDGALLVLVGNPHNPRLKREWEAREGSDWPRDERGRPYHVSHKRALADGGTNTLDNIEPMHPDEHMAMHKADGDLSRWAKRQWIARAFGGRVAEAIGPLGFLSDIPGVLSGRIRTDTFDNFAHDMIGQPSFEDQRKAWERYQRAIDPNWKPGQSAI